MSSTNLDAVSGADRVQTPPSRPVTPPKAEGGSSNKSAYGADKAKTVASSGEQSSSSIQKSLEEILSDGAEHDLEARRAPQARLRLNQWSVYPKIEFKDPASDRVLEEKSPEDLSPDFNAQLLRLQPQIPDASVSLGNYVNRKHLLSELKKRELPFLPVTVKSVGTQIHGSVK
jgi:hypothetical protein